MRDYVIVTDSNSDLLPGYAKENGIIELELTYTIQDKTYRCNDPALSRSDFYALMRDGNMPKTAAINLEEASALLAPALEAGKGVLCILFSSALSGTYNSVRLAAQELAERYPSSKIEVIDSLCASGGEGMLVERAVEYRHAGLSMEENAAQIQKDVLHIAHLFTVDDLFHLHRGGRVSAASAVVGSVLGIKPVLHVDDAGRLVPTGKVRGRRQALAALVSNMEKQIDPEKCDRFAICHGDCEKDAQFVADEVKKRFGLSRYTIGFVGPTVGAHSGPGTVALFFYAKQR